MAATSRSLPLIIPPGIKLDIKLELADDSLLALTEEQVLQSTTIRDATVDAELYTLTIPLTKYPPEEVRRFFSLFDQIEQRADLAQQKVTLSQLFNLLPLADFFAAETIIDNLIDYILATILANPNMSEKMRKEVQDKYEQLFVGLQHTLYRRLAIKVSELSVKNVRTLIAGQERLELLNVIITDRGQIATNYGESYEGYGGYINDELLYDETSTQRTKQLNQLVQELMKGQIDELGCELAGIIDSLRFKLGGIVNDKTSLLFHTNWHDKHTNVYEHKNEYYGPRQLIGVNVTTSVSINFARLLLYGNRVAIRDPRGSKGLNTEQLLSIYKAARANGQQIDELDQKIFDKQHFACGGLPWAIYRIIELPGQKVLFSNLIPDMIYENQDGKYVVTVTNISTGAAIIKSASMVLELFEVDSKKRLFRIILDELQIETIDTDLSTDNITIDPVRQLLYVKIENQVKISYSTTDTTIWLPVILVINFKGEVIHRYFAPAPYNIYFRLAGPRLISIELSLGQPLTGNPIVVENGRFLGDYSDFIAESEISKYQEIAQLPPYEPFPQLPLKAEEYHYDPEDEVFTYGGIWLRDPANGFQPIARISDLPYHVTDIHRNIKVNSSPHGHYITLNMRETGKVQVYKLTSYDQAEEKAIRDILTPITEIQPLAKTSTHQEDKVNILPVIDS